MTAVGQRVNAVPALSKILASGTEGGKEFGRIVGLLLFNDAKRRGEEFNLFDDASGDFEGLDGFSRTKQSSSAIGYQYKFFSSPLSNDHRQEIIKSLDNALERNETLNLVRWVLVTPDDFKNPAQRKGGGDVGWFEKLKVKYKDKLELDHIGHSKLQDLFLQTHHLCLYYYPGHVNLGVERRKTIHELRAQYDENMRRRYGRIEFVGMSVYKEETSRRIPLEDIYIPLSLVSERASEETDQTPRIEALSLLEPGSRSVILGDPGSGKSTLLAFLALAGISERLQSRCGYFADGRLTIVVTLRRYADELKIDKNLSILEYVRKVAEADFNLSGLSPAFYEYYLETGQAVVLFDGLDELPGYQFKNIVRHRVESFTSNFPGNTIILSSRIVGYEAEARFDESYNHFRVAKLKIEEVKNFIIDWYSLRVEDVNERDRNANDLIRVIVSPESDSIRALARNPLLLTIVALVHRIDAVLPDQRVVLYQKCTETLLNTWYKAKRNDEEVVKGRIEQRNRVRVESIAYWMHTRSVRAQGRSVAEHKELLEFLTDHIKKYESIKEADDHAEDQAEAFLSFIKNSAGLLVEAGDGLYSFIHLTFQEYLCATYLLAFGETRGAQSIWDELHGALQNPRWREVVRLLVASLKSSSGKAFFIDKLLDEPSSASTRDTALLLLGLLRDSIEAAELRAEDIFSVTHNALALCQEIEDFVDLKQSVEGLVTKDAINLSHALSAFNSQFQRASASNRLRLALISYSLGYPGLDGGCSGLDISMSEETCAVFNALVLSRSDFVVGGGPLGKLRYVYNEWATKNSEANAASTVGLGVLMLLDPSNQAEKLFDRELFLMFSRNFGPHHDHGLHLAAIACASTTMHPTMIKALGNALRGSSHTNKKQVRSFLAPAIKVWLSENLSRPTGVERFYDALDERQKFEESGIKFEDERRLMRRGRSQAFPISSLRRSLVGTNGSYDDSYWEGIRKTDVFSNYLVPSLEVAFEESFDFYWGEAFRGSLKLLPLSFNKYFDPDEWLDLAVRIKDGKYSVDDVNFAAWLILYDVWVYLRKGYDEESMSPIAELISIVSGLDEPKIKLSIVLRSSFFNSTESVGGLSSLLASDERVMEVLETIGWPSAALITKVKASRRNSLHANNVEDDVVEI
ncbi:NACHT domain-containing protein [Pseudomonas syringae]|uniref:NACHT domain-containing protein n=1 Tax=Pseudomonas syringae TaxID=317 RepID=A0A9Q3X661_PSESX|nr:NACHT domain-containing protein [Pseudomonas syringae]MCF5063839.1 NACHT domain-containing protein [Pseudomonas syringae]MCF5073091.1 NACHT domain-containing protein [Pseudomonas syringae]MCF5118022.1 NACHT domain-containing protein [Pseudomonas syringae]MCF5378550.1 NACHT domain-containing protein [Pseudomonas syringae]